MLQFFHDSALTVGNNQNNPKRFVSPLKGIQNKQSVVYMGDPYIASLTAAALSGAVTLFLNKTDEFLSSGTAQIKSGTSTYTITYTGKTISTLTGVSGVTAPVNIGDIVKPWKVYKSTGNFTFIPRGTDLSNLQVSVGTSTTTLNYPGSIAIFPIGTYDTVLDSPVAVYISIGCNAGIEIEFPNWSVTSNPIYTRDKNDSSSITSTEVGNTIVLAGYVSRRNNYEIVSLRLLPTTRAISVNEPGFILGSYRWRDSTNSNSQVIIPTKWDLDTSNIGDENFISGIGHGNDLIPIDVEAENNSIFARINNGFYFAGATRYFLPANPIIQFVNGNQTGFVLDPIPNIGSPVFVGVWGLDANKFYRTIIEYRYQASQVFKLGENVPLYQYTLNKKTNLLTINNILPSTPLFLGLLSGENIDYFDMPMYPVDSITSIYVDRGIGNASLFSTNYIFDRQKGTVQVIAPTSGLETSIPNANIGEPVYATYNPAYAVVYDSGNSQERLIDSVDLNPAFAGISSGYLYLQHRRQKPESLVLSADKPLIDIPATFSSIIDLIAYGPIYFDGDYSLLTVEAFGALNGEVIPNAQLEIVPGPNFSGTINYQDPTTTTVTAITGSDGKANFLYLPDSGFGYYIPKIAASGGLAGIATTIITNDTLVLPAPIAIDEIFNTSEGWLVGTYNILNTDPIYGIAGGNIALGQLPFTTIGIPGSAGYKTNGEKTLWSVGTVGIQPIDARDSSNNSYTSSSFNGQVVKLIYSTAVISTSNIGAYFITFIQRVSLQVKYVDSNIISNTILLEMALSNPINNNPWLTLNDATQGILNQYRLGWQQDLPNSL